MKFTQQGKQIDRQIEEYLKMIVKIILEEIPEVKSVLLGGGFGRGEGSAWVDVGKVVPQNDFELFLITKKSVKESLLNEVANKAIKKLDFGPVGADFYDFKREVFANTFYIDMKAIPIKKLSQLLPMFRYFELKNASHLLWGKDYRYLMPDFKIKDLPLTEGLRLLFNRMALLCLYFSFDFLKGMSFAEKHGLLYLGGKAYTDLGGALTQLNHTYKPSYLSRLQMIKKTYERGFPSLYREFPEIPKIIEEGTKFKLKPNFSIKIDPYQTWVRQKKYIKEVTIYFAEKFFAKKFKNIFAVVDFLYQEGHKYYYHPYLNYILKKKTSVKIKSYWLVYFLIPILNLLFFLRILKTRKKIYPRVLFNRRTPDLTIFAAMIYILYGIKSKKIVDKKCLTKAKLYLRKTYPLTKSKKGSFVEEWEVLKDDFSNAFLLFSFLKLV